jgi:GntR family transcriptional repressor for pyruvate dehydrogenase complex
VALTDDAIDRIRGMIVSGDLEPGQRLPPEKELSELLGLSRNSLREAVKALELVNVLDVRRGDGTYVTTLEPSLLVEAFSFVMEFTRDSSLRELLEVRTILEPAASALAVGRLGDDELEQLRQMVDDASEASGVEQLVAHDLEFHRLIARGSGNAYLSSLLDALGTETVRARIWRGITEEGAVERTLTEHRRIVDALVAGDAELVRSLVTAHVDAVEAWVRRSMPLP